MGDALELIRLCSLSHKVSFCIIQEMSKIIHHKVFTAALQCMWTSLQLRLADFYISPGIPTVCLTSCHPIPGCGTITGHSFQRFKAKEMQLFLIH